MSAHFCGAKVETGNNRERIPAPPQPRRSKPAQSAGGTESPRGTKAKHLRGNILATQQCVTEGRGNANEVS